MTEEASIRILVVDDHQMFARTLIRFLSNEPDFEVLEVATSGREALEALDRLSPDVIVLDYELPDIEGPAVVAEVKATRPETKVIMVSGHPDEVVKAAAIEAGCSGFVSKFKAVDELVDTVRAAHTGRSSLSPHTGPG